MGASQLLDADPVHAERMRRLEAANEIRYARSRIRKALAVREADAAELLRAPPRCIGGVRTLDFLTWLPRVGKTRARTLLRDAKIPLEASGQLDKLSPVTRERLLDAIAKRVG